MKINQLFAAICAMVLVTSAFSQSKLKYKPSAELLLKAKEFQKSEKYDKAVEQLEQIHEGDSLFFSQVLWEKMFCYSNLERYERVKEIGDQYWNFRDKLPTEFYLAYGTALDNLELFTEAEHMYQVLLEEFPTNHSLWYNYGVSLSKAGRHQEAYETFKKTVVINPMYDRVHLAIANYALREKETTKAILALNMYAWTCISKRSNLGAIQLLNEIVSSKYWNDPKIEESTGINMDKDEDFSEIDQLVHNYLALDKKYKIPSALSYNYLKQSHLVFTQLLKEDLKEDGFWANYYVKFYQDLMKQGKFEGWSYLSANFIDNPKAAALVKKNSAKAIDAYKWAVQHTTTSNTEPDLTFIGLGKTRIERGENPFHISIAGNFTYDRKTDKINGEVDIYGVSGRKVAEGKFNSVGKKDGLWKYYHSNGNLKEVSYYINGELTDSSWSYLPNGLKQYKLNFVNDKINGDVFVYENGVLRNKMTYTNGEFKNGQYVRYFPNGAVDFQYEVKDGKPEGELLSLFDSGELFKRGTYKAGEMDGPQTTYFRNGNVRVKENYLNGKLHGDFERFFEDGKLEIKGKYVNGNQAGEWMTYYEDGKQKVVQNYDETGKQNGQATFYNRDGSKLYEMTYKKGDVVAYKYFTRDGNVATEGERKTGDFLFKSIHPNGNTESEGYYGKKEHNGKWMTYDINGNLFIEREYENGVNKGTHKRYYSNGKIEIQYDYNKEGNAHGYYFDNFRNGKLYKQGYMNNDEWDGPWEEYYHDQSLRTSYFYINGELNGYRHHYLKNNKKRKSEFFENDLLKFTIYYDTAGVAFDTLFNLPELTRSEIRYCESCPLFLETEMMNTRFHGAITYYFPNGKVILKGQNFNGRRHGDWVWYHANGKIKSTGTYHYGDKHGVWKEFNEEGKLTNETTYHYGDRHGLRTDYDDNGKISFRANYEYDELHGIAEYYIGGEQDHTRRHHEGVLIEYSYKKNGQTITTPVKNETAEIEIYWNNGKLARKFTIKNGWFEGEYEKFYSSGQLHSKQNYIHDWRDGLVIEYHPNGKKASEATYKFGFKDGEVTEYHLNGTVKSKATYLLGNLFGTYLEYSDKGNEIKKWLYYDDEIIAM